MAEKKNLTKVRDIAKRYDEGFILCRTVTGHSWKPAGASWLQGGNIEQVLACTRCEAQRVQVLDKRGYLVSRHYQYPDGYAIPGMGHMDQDGRAILRITAVRKMLE